MENPSVPADVEAPVAVEQPRSRRFELGPAAVLGAVAACWSVVFGVLVWRRHDRFGTFGFDLGIYDQATWLLSRLGPQLITVRGLEVFGHHASVGLYLFAPAYWLGAGPQFLDLFQVVVVALGTVPIYLLARLRFGRPWPGVVLGVVFLLHPAAQFLVWETFHPETLAITPLLAAYYCSVRERWGWFALWSTLAVVQKEDVALAVLVLGVVVALRGRRDVGLLTAGLSLLWFVGVSQVLLPAVNGEHAFYESFFGELGGSPTEMAGNAVRDPTLVTGRLAAPDARGYLWELFAPYGFAPVLAPGLLLIGAPQLLVNLLSINGFTREITFHYAALPLSALTIALVEGTAWLDRHLRAPFARRGVLGFVACCAVAGTVAWGPSPVGVRYDDGWWPSADDERRDAKKAAIAAVPDGAAVSASYQFVPHLTHREEIYEFPNPFAERNWGIDGKDLPDPAGVDWVVVDRRVIGAPDEATLREIEESGGFREVFESDGVVVLERED